MNKNSLACNEQLLIAMQQNELSADAADDLLAHVENCTSCQHRLQELAAPSQDWLRATAAFSGTPENGDGIPTFDHPSFGPASMTWNESMAKQLLSPSSHPEMLGRLGRYNVERLIGAGGMGIVLKAFDGELNRPVAIKILAPHLAGCGQARQRFAREARAAAAVVHKHVVPIFNVETERDNPFIVMQFISGESLQARIDREGQFDLCKILRIGMQVADGLAAAHLQGIVHRDIKPSNILMEEDVERALITDFGLARAADDASLTRTGFHPGTPQYMSPEQSLGQSLDARSDLFSLGSMLYTMCTGRAPFRAESSLGVMRRISESTPTPIRELNPDIPEWLCAIIGKLMAKDKADRFQTATEVHELLKGCLSHVQHPETCQLPEIPNLELAKTATQHPPRGKHYLVTLGSVAVAGLMGVLLLNFIFPLGTWLGGIAQPKPLDPPGKVVDRAAEMQQAIIGTWRTIFAEDSGKPGQPDSPVEITFTEQTATMSERGFKQEATYTLDVSQTPHTIDLTSHGHTKPGIFDLQGDTLRLCFSENTAQRPTAFDSQPDSVNDLVLTLKRFRPEKTGETQENPAPK